MSAYDDRALTSGADDAPRTNVPATRSAVGGSSASTGPTGPETRGIDQERLDRLTAMYEALDGGGLGGRAAAAAAAATGAEAEAAYQGFGRRSPGLAQHVPMQTPALAHFGRAGQMLAGEAPSRATPAVLGLPPQRAALPALEPMAAASPIPHEDYARRLARVEQLLDQQGDPDKLLQLEMVRFMAEMRSSRRSDPLESYDPRDELGGAAKTSAGKAFAAMEAQRNKVYSQPGRIVEEFRRMAMDELGADLGTPWRFRDLHRRVNWGQMKSMQRCFIQDVCVLDLMEQGLYREAHAQVVQNAKSKHQMSLDGGSWRVAWQFSGLADPLTKKKWAGTARELEVYADVVRAEDEIQKRARNSLRGVLSDDDKDEDVEGKKTAAERKAAAAAAKKAKGEGKGGKP